MTSSFKEGSKTEKGIAVAGNMIVDIAYPVLSFPAESELTTITGKASKSVGGLVCNVAIDLAKLDATLPVQAIGLVGDDPEGELMLSALSEFENIDIGQVGRMGRSSVSIVMNSEKTKTRTFFQDHGNNACFDESYIDWDKTNADIFHVGYILLLDALDESDDEYVTKMARLLAHAKEHGIKTSIDVVTEAGQRFKRLVRPALKYTDYCIINEIEAGAVSGIEIRGSDGKLKKENILPALRKIKELGVTHWAVIHCPEGGYGLDEDDRYAEFQSLKLPEGYIKGAVGAGDAFCAGVLYSAHAGKTLSEGLKLGTCTAAASLSALGATDGVKSIEEVLELCGRFGNSPV